MSEVEPELRAGAPAKAFEGLRTVDSHVQTIDGTPDQVFPLICPVREAEWADGWVGRPIHAPSGLAEENGVYASEHEGEREPTIWLITRRDPATHDTEFVYFAPGRQVVRISIRIEPLGATRSKVFIRYIRTGISEEGNRIIAQARRERAFGAMMEEWECAMNHYLATGRLLTSREWAARVRGGSARPA